MKTEKLYRVRVYDSTANDCNNESQAFTCQVFLADESLRTCNDMDYALTKEQAEELKAEFDKQIKENDLDNWASTSIEEDEFAIAENLQDIADFYNDCDVLDVNQLEALIASIGCESDCGSQYDICHNDKEKIIIVEDKAIVVEND